MARDYVDTFSLKSDEEKALMRFAAERKGDFWPSLLAGYERYQKTLTADQYASLQAEIKSERDMPRLPMENGEKVAVINRYRINKKTRCFNRDCVEPATVAVMGDSAHLGLCKGCLDKMKAEKAKR